MKILIVDDCRSLCDWLSLYLTSKGFESTPVYDGRNALALIKNKKFDGVLLELTGTEFSGYEIIEALENNGKLIEYKIIIFTIISLSKTEIEEFQNKGIYACLEKPVNTPVILQTLESLKGR